MDYAAHFSQGLTYDAFLAAHANDEQKRRWQAVQAAVKLTEPQRQLLQSFTRQMKVLCLAGAWCGDCVNQCPIFQHFASANEKIELRFLDRDANPSLAESLRICGGARVPVVVFLSEDDQFVASYGDRTLSKYRQVVAELSGAACPSGLVVPDASSLAAVTQDWLNEFERAQWVLRTSGRLRQLHGD